MEIHDGCDFSETSNGCVILSQTSANNPKEPVKPIDNRKITRKGEDED